MSRGAACLVDKPMIDITENERPVFHRRKDSAERRSVLRPIAWIALGLAVFVLVAALLFTQEPDVVSPIQDGWYWMLRQFGLARDYIEVPYDFP